MYNSWFYLTLSPPTLTSTLTYTFPQLGSTGQCLIASNGTGTLAWQFLNTLGTVTTGTWNATTIGVGNGGTGVTSSTAYAIMAGGTTSTGAHQSLATGSSNQILISNGSSALPSWTTNLTVAQGGTGLVSTTAYGVLCGGTSTTGNLQNAGTGTTNYVLTSNGSSALPTWQQTQLQHCSDCNISSPSTNQILTYNGSQWQNNTK